MGVGELVENGGEIFAFVARVVVGRFEERGGGKGVVLGEVRHAKTDQAHRTASGWRPFAIEEFEGEVAKRQIVAGRKIETCLACERGEAGVAQFDFTRAGASWLSTGPSAHIGDELKQRGPHDVAVGFILAECVFTRNALLLFVVPGDTGKVDAVCVRLDGFGRGFTENAREKTRIGVLNVAAGPIAVAG